MKRIFLTGATGSMGSKALIELLKDKDNEIITLVLPSARDKKFMEKYANEERIKVRWGDLTNFADVESCVREADIVLHVGAFVSPEADYHPKRAMEINYGSTMNIIEAVKRRSDPDEVKLVYIGTVAETGDRMPPIHWGRIGDPLKPSVHDYYAVSKIAAERAVIESGLRYWVSLRQTGILSEKMSKINDPIMFHNCLDNVLEYVTDCDSATMLRNCCKDLPDNFWRHIYNIGGGESCRLSAYQMMKDMFGLIGITKPEYAIEAKWFATRNFHGQYYLDSDKLESFLHFRNTGKEYYYDLYLRNLGITAAVARIITKLPAGQKLVGYFMKKKFRALARTERGTLNFIERGLDDYIDPFFISLSEWKRIGPMEHIDHFREWDKIIPIDHGYDETKPPSELNIVDMKRAAIFRGGECLSDSMSQGDLSAKLRWKCAFGHQFEASPTLVLEGGHWCPECERTSWNYHEVAKVNPFFAQVWYPLHDRSEPSREYPKTVSELDVELNYSEV